ncbi:alpha/beta hydrolase [Leekyejoonella antrihumi]|nr:alpha/beta hydrolase-fold protein [Leekyejoonella antrihumi]
MPLPGRTTHLSTRALVYLPPQYFEPGWRGAKFPVVETFSGFPGDVLQLVDRLAYPQHLLTAIRAGTARPMILVMLDPAVVLPRDTECTNIPHGPQVLTYLAKDVPEDLRAHLRVSESAWGAMGHSTGGYCATKLAMLHPRQFSTAASLSGYYHAISDVTTGSLWGGSRSVRDVNDPEWRLRHLAPPHVSILATVGTLEGGSDGIVDSRLFASLARPPMVVQLVVVHGGGHNFTDYQLVLPEAFGWLSTHLTQSRTAS